VRRQLAQKKAWNSDTLVAGTRGEEKDRRNGNVTVGMDLKKGKCMDSEDPFKSLKIKNWMILEDISERQPCTICKKSRKYFCYNCYIPVQTLQGHLPTVKVMFYIV
jgi:hypothetical protein